jgi:hypothetical protein
MFRAISMLRERNLKSMANPQTENGFTAISLSEFAEATGLNKRKIIHAINGLVSKKIIVIKTDNSGQNLYAINKNVNEWVGLPKKKPLSGDMGR